MTDSGLAGGIGDLVDVAASFWKRVLGGFDVNRLDATSAAKDLDDWIAASASFAVRLADQFTRSGGGDLPPARDATTWTGTMTVLPSVTQRPLTLRCDGLRAVGQGAGMHVRADAVTFDPPVLTEGQNDFTVTVTFVTTSDRTVLFEGDIESRETDAPVTDPVRPNNRDGGAVP